MGIVGVRGGTHAGDGHRDYLVGLEEGSADLGRVDHPKHADVDSGLEERNTKAAFAELLEHRRNTGNRNGCDGAGMIECRKGQPHDGVNPGRKSSSGPQKNRQWESRDRHHDVDDCREEPGGGIMACEYALDQRPGDKTRQLEDDPDR